MPFNADTADRLIGGRYALEMLIARGGMGEVWRARHIDLKSTVAIKFLSAGSIARESARKRFLIEAQVAARLKSKYAVQVFDFGFTDAGQPYLVMELFDGETLAARIQREKRLTPETAFRFMAQSARALERAHRLGIVHRDFKPENILIAEDEEGKESIKILDFGVAKLLVELDDLGHTDNGVEPPKRQPSNLTRSGAILGTPFYMAPEQITASRDLGPAADVWALGVVTFVCLTGVMPFDGRSVPDLFANILKGRHVPARLANTELPPRFEAWFERACAPKPSERFASARDAALELGAALSLQSHPEDLSQFQALVREGDRSSVRALRVVSASGIEDVHRLRLASPRPASIPPARATSTPPPEPGAARRDALLERAQARAYRLAIAAFVAGAALALAVERLGMWLSQR